MIIGFTAGLVNLAIFLCLLQVGVSLLVSAVSAFVIAAAVNYFLCIAFLFRHKARWNTAGEIFAYILVVAAAGALDVGITSALVAMETAPWLAKTLASMFGVVLNYLGRRYLVF